MWGAGAAHHPAMCGSGHKSGCGLTAESWNSGLGAWAVLWPVVGGRVLGSKGVWFKGRVEAMCGGEGKAQAGGDLRQAAGEAALTFWARDRKSRINPIFPQLPGNAQDSIFRASHFSLLSLSNTKNLYFRKAGAGASQSLPPKPTLRF